LGHFVFVDIGLSLHGGWVRAGGRGGGGAGVCGGVFVCVPGAGGHAGGARGFVRPPAGCAGRFFSGRRRLGRSGKKKSGPGEIWAILGLDGVLLQAQLRRVAARRGASGRSPWCFRSVSGRIRGALAGNGFCGRVRCRARRHGNLLKNGLWARGRGRAWFGAAAAQGRSLDLFRAGKGRAGAGAGAPAWRRLASGQNGPRPTSSRVFASSAGVGGAGQGFPGRPRRSNALD
jgi:hypothetical protein